MSYHTEKKIDHTVDILKKRRKNKTKRHGRFSIILFVLYCWELAHTILRRFNG